MDLSGYSLMEIIQLYSDSIKELKVRGVLRTNNVLGELGEYIAIEHYMKNTDLPNLHAVPVGTQNINALSISGERYAIKSTSGQVTGVFYGLEPPDSNEVDSQLFEYVIICKFDENCSIQGIYQLDWNHFLIHKKWHSRMKAWNLTLTRALKNDALVVFENRSEEIGDKLKSEEKKVISRVDNQEISDWNITKKVDHAVVRKETAILISRMLKVELSKDSQSRYISIDKKTAVFVLSASYSQKNQEYWYSINDENIPWLELFPNSYIVFALGSSDKLLIFTFAELKNMLPGCLKTQNDESKKKKSHYHFSFAVEGKNIVYFKRKLSEREFVNVSANLRE